MTEFNVSHYRVRRIVCVRERYSALLVFIVDDGSAPFYPLRVFTLKDVLVKNIARVPRRVELSHSVIRKAKGWLSWMFSSNQVAPSSTPFEVINIINRHLNKDSDVLLCQDELIEAGFAEWAKL